MNSEKITFINIYKRYIYITKFISILFYFIFDTIFIIPILAISIISRFIKKPIFVGLGPDPMVNHYYHILALNKNFKSESYSFFTWHVTDRFDYIMSKNISLLFLPFFPYIMFLRVIFKYENIFLSFNGGPLKYTLFAKFLEPIFYKISNKKIIMLPYGSDIFSYEEAPSDKYKELYKEEYPNFKNSITRKLIINVYNFFSDYIISGQDWIFYMKNYDLLIPSHICIDTEEYSYSELRKDLENNKTPLTILHAPNHRKIKGTESVITAVSTLKSEGYNVELNIVEKKSRVDVQKSILEADLVIDQLIVGFYAMFAIESMSMGRPVISYIDDRLYNLYKSNNHYNDDNFPIIRSDSEKLLVNLRYILNNRHVLRTYSKLSRKYAVNMHSIDYMSVVFKKIFRGLNNGNRK